MPMIAYNPKDWFSILFRFHKADTFRKLLPLIVAIGIYSAAVAWFEISVLRLGPDSRIRNLSLIHTTLGLVISMLLVFRTNTAYDRWWEGRKIWGSLVNASRNLALKLSHLAPGDRGYFRVAIPNHVVALKNHLRSEFLLDELRSSPGFDPGVLDPSGHVPNQVARHLIGRIYELERAGILRPEHVLGLQTELNTFTDAAGACERIRKTPIPYSYSVFLKKFIFLYVMSLPFAYVVSLGYLIVPVVCGVFYVLASLEVIAEEIEDPFGTDANDLPLDSIVETVRISVDEILGA
jgi:putative membrane protein